MYRRYSVVSCWMHVCDVMRITEKAELVGVQFDVNGSGFKLLPINSKPADLLIWENMKSFSFNVKKLTQTIPYQEPITRSEHLPYLLLELSFLQTELFLERLSRQANNAFVYWPTRAPHYFCNKWINYLDFPTFINMADSSDEFESDLSCESEYESVESGIAGRDSERVPPYWIHR